MRITELLKKESIELGVKVADKNAAIDKLISLMDAGVFCQALFPKKSVRIPCF